MTSASAYGSWISASGPWEASARDAATEVAVDHHRAAGREERRDRDQPGAEGPDVAFAGEDQVGAVGAEGDAHAEAAAEYDYFHEFDPTLEIGGP